MGQSNNKLTKEALDNLRKTIAHPSPSALIFGYLKEKDLNLKDMTVEQWKEIEMDLVEILLSEIYPGEDITEDQLNFTTLTHSIAFMSNFIETLNRNLDSMKAEEAKTAENPKEQEKKFEI